MHRRETCAGLDLGWRGQSLSADRQRAGPGVVWLQMMYDHYMNVSTEEMGPMLKRWCDQYFSLHDSF